MAEQALEIETASDVDYVEHERTYHRFLGMVKWGATSVAVVLILMAIFLL